VKFEYGKSRAVLKLKAVTDREERKSIVKEIKHFDKERAKIPPDFDKMCTYKITYPHFQLFSKNNQ
jgi:hypothetical protein